MLTTVEQITNEEAGNQEPDDSAYNNTQKAFLCEATGQRAEHSAQQVKIAVNILLFRMLFNVLFHFNICLINWILQANLQIIYTPPALRRAIAGKKPTMYKQSYLFRSGQQAASHRLGAHWRQPCATAFRTEGRPHLQSTTHAPESIRRSQQP